MDNSIHIVGIGARTSVGIGAAHSAAAVRAGIMALSHHPFILDRKRQLVPGALDTELDPLVMGPKRLVGLAESALREACAPLTVVVPRKFDVPVYVGLPESRPGLSDRDADIIRAGIFRFDRLPINVVQVNTFSEGHAAGLTALAAAVEEMQQGGREMCLVGGIDSYFHPDTMEWLERNRQLAGPSSRSGFVPGEGAGFCLLMTDGSRARLELKSLALVRSVVVGRETKLIKTTDMCLGEGLSATVRAAVAGLRMPAERINGIVCDINGERYRSEEWGFVCLRMSDYFDDPTAYLSPAECWGDVGAASGPLFAMLACEGFARGYAKGPRSLLWSSSERGQRCAAVLAAAPDEGEEQLSWEP